jgi:hypothetical protein
VTALAVTLTVDELRSLVREEIRAALTPAKTEPEALYLSVSKFAAHVAMSERTIWNLITKGLPTIGSGRGRRVDVRAALEWMRGQKAQVDDSVERSARRAARRAASRAT